jgi:hypothetical protein
MSRDEAIQFASFEDREPLVERVLKHRMGVLLMLGTTNGSPFAQINNRRKKVERGTNGKNQTVGSE